MWIVAMVPMWATGQEIRSFTVPLSLCAGDTAEVTFGFTDERTVMVSGDESSQEYSGQIFLPDGVPCGSMGCSYRSPVVFSGFPANATVSSAEDIKYIRLNMEHSYIGDIYINITCPNGQVASLMNWKGTGSSSCSSTVPTNNRGWTSGNNASGSTYLGQAYDHANGDYPCDPTANGNQPGVGWNYCWSNNTTSGYSYAPGDGLIYRAANVTNGKIDSSNVAAHTNFYHPEDHFSTLEGCPLNGTWYIEVLDAYSQDNGYIFEWEFSLDEALLPTPYCNVTGFSLEGDSIEMVDDSSFIIRTPRDLTHDTVFLYTYTIHTECGDIDTVIPLAVHPTYQRELRVDSCDGIFWEGHSYTSNANITLTQHTAYGCDSVTHAHLYVHPSFLLQESTAVVENALPYLYLGRSFAEPVSDSLLEEKTVYGCDSNIVFNLTVYPNKYSDTTVRLCSEQTPYQWNGLTLTETVDTSVTLSTSMGADSVVALFLTVYPHGESTFYDTICSNSSIVFGDSVYNLAGSYSYNLRDMNGCDSTLTLHLETISSVAEAKLSVIPRIVTPTDRHFTLHDQSRNAATREWYLLDNVFTERDVECEFPDDGRDSIAVMLKAYSTEGCHDSCSTTILIDRSTLFVPNVFTPDRETNNRWQPIINQVETMEMWIYNREGLLVTHLEGVDAQWDGTTSDGTPCPQGAYVYHLQYHTTVRPGHTKTETGTVLLLR